MKIVEMKNKYCHKSMTGNPTNCIGTMFMACREGIDNEYHCADIYR